MKKKSKPEIHQIAGLLVAKATGSEVPIGAKPFEKMVKVSKPAKKAKKKK